MSRPFIQAPGKGKGPRPFTIVRYRHGDRRFEILVDPQKAFDFKRGKKIPLSEVLAIDEIYSDANKGMRVSAEDLQVAFGTTDFERAVEIILKRGKLLLTAEQRKQMIEEKKKAIISLLSRNCVDPRTGLPHPPRRIELAMEEVGVKIDPFIPAEEQLEDVMKALAPVLPLKVERAKIAIKIPPAYVMKCYGVVRRFGKILKEEWQKDGSWIALVELPAGLKLSFLEKLSSLTKGTLMSKELKE